jgi:hypothetical protein
MEGWTMFDKLSDALYDARYWVLDHLRYLGAGLVAVVVVVGASFAFLHFKNEPVQATPAQNVASACSQIKADFYQKLSQNPVVAQDSILRVKYNCALKDYSKAVLDLNDALKAQQSTAKPTTKPTVKATPQASKS